MKRAPHKKIPVLALILALGLLAACAPAPTEGETPPISVVATVFPAFDLARQVAGEAASVTMLFSPDKEPHFFEPSSADVDLISRCDLFIYVGGASDRWVEELLPTLTLSGRVLRLMDFVSPLAEQALPGPAAALSEEIIEGPVYDEHIWMSLQNAMAMTNAVSNALAELAPALSGQFYAQASNYTRQLEALDETFRQIVAEAARSTLVFAGCFPARYFTEAYGLNYYALFPGCTPEIEPSAAAMAFLVDRVRSEEIPMVLYVEFSSQELADTVAWETSAEKRLFHTCHTVTREQLQEGVGYLELMGQNAETLREALN